ncbi:uncharacterized protein VTP21DRAFT_3357 [Calcarisporiella thermophila]|uniref:uncharacterized protein n=1 Tax=Calcarisporiella thermophila TaxID=911321 RepID=UPI0037422C44
MDSAAEKTRGTCKCIFQTPYLSLNLSQANNVRSALSRPLRLLVDDQTLRSILVQVERKDKEGNLRREAGENVSVERRMLKWLRKSVE